MIDAIFAYLARTQFRILDRYAASTSRKRKRLFGTLVTLGFIFTVPLLAFFLQGSFALIPGARVILHRPGAPVLSGKNLPAGSFLRNGEMYHLCRGSETASSLATRYYSFTDTFLLSELESGISLQNTADFSQGHCREGAAIRIPGNVNELARKFPLKIGENQPIRAVYVRGDKAKPDWLTEEMETWKNSGINGVVIDVKDITGVVNYKSSVPSVEQIRMHSPPIKDFSHLIRFFHENGIYVIARQALFQDMVLAKKRPELALKDQNAPGGIYLVKGSPLWVDPGYSEVRQYNLDILAELIRMGVDEVQFDYVRYPAEGDLSGVSFYQVDNPSDKTRHLSEFLSGAWEMTRGTGVKVAIDVFGIVAWGESLDEQITGQRIDVLSSYVDVISPMLYPSHFQHGYEGIANPADHGYYFYSRGVSKILAKTGARVNVRPWIQAFPWRVTNYNESYILDQIKGSNDSGGLGWMMWNAGNEYTTVYRALTPKTTRK